jgi:hypothetical protein
MKNLMLLGMRNTLLWWDQSCMQQPSLDLTSHMLLVSWLAQQANGIRHMSMQQDISFDTCVVPLTSA